jgi:septum formation protein
LKELVPEFLVIPADVDESRFLAGHPETTGKALAREKAEAVFALHTDALVIGADTVVAVEEGPDGWLELGKPSDPDDAKRMLRMLSGRTHLVVTGIAVIHAGFAKVVADTTRVTFRDLTDTEIEQYVASGEPSDKAGAYAIQGGAKGFVERVAGSVSNVVGLPLELLGSVLVEAGVDLWRAGSPPRGTPHP